MYQNIYIERSKEFGKNIVHLWDDEKEYQAFEFENYAYKLSNGYDNYKTLYGDNVRKVVSWSKWDVDNGKIFESDVNLNTRVLVDLYHENDKISNNHRKFYFDIEVDIKDGLPNFEKANNKITSISFYDEMSDEYFVLILDEHDEIEHIRYSNEEIIPFSNEVDLLSAFLMKWEEIAPTIVTGWNVDGFDIPYLYRRLTSVLGKDFANKLSPIGIVKYNEYRHRYFIAGVSVLDYLALYKQYTYTQLPSYTLDAVSKFELNEGKVVYDGNLDTLRSSDINKFIEYSLVDTKLVVKLDRKLNFIELVQAICHKGHVPYEDVYFSSRWIEGTILTYMKRRDIVAPNKNKELAKEMNGEVKFSGAYVKSPESGKYEWFYDLDFTSLYPSIIMTLNISPETKRGVISNWNANEYNNQDIEYDVIDEGKLNSEQLKKYLENNNYSISANGVIYDQHTQGLIPQILSEWSKDKENYDKLMKQYAKKGDLDQSKYYKQLRTVVKVMLNSIYGVLGLPIFRFYDLDNAEAVTTTGVHLIKYTEKMVNYYYSQITKEEKDYCIYIDTDSIFFPAKPLVEKLYLEVDTTNVEEMTTVILKITTKVQNFLNKSFSMYSKRFLNCNKHQFDIKQEVISRSGLWVTKKRYVQWIINENGIKVDKIEYKGLDIIRSNFPKSFKGILKTVSTDLLKDVAQELIDEKILEFKNMIKNVKLSDIATPTSVKNIKKYGTKQTKAGKRFSNWKKGTPAHVKAAISYNEFLLYYNLEKYHHLITSGEKILWIYLKENPFGMNGLAFRGYDDPQQVIDFLNKYIDRSKMFNRVLLSKLEDFYKAVNWILPSIEKQKANIFFNF